MVRAAVAVLLLAVIAIPADAAGPVPQAAATDQPFVMIVHPSNPASELTRGEVSDIFLKHTTEWPTRVPVHPVDQAQASATRHAFSRAVFGKDVQSYWYQQLYAGRSVPPLEVPDDGAVVAAVRDDPGAIGYIASGPLPVGVKAVRVMP